MNHDKPIYDFKKPLKKSKSLEFKNQSELGSIFSQTLKVKKKHII
jgi:hypothetical protein